LFIASIASRLMSLSPTVKNKCLPGYLCMEARSQPALSRGIGCIGRARRVDAACDYS
jgi:hypothetical protein